MLSKMSALYRSFLGIRVNLFPLILQYVYNTVLTFLSEGLVSSGLDSAEQLSSLHTGDKHTYLLQTAHMTLYHILYINFK